MDSFTFGVFTYNQEKFIIEHLESIKRVIEKYGSDYLIYIVISDDASKDRTVSYAKMWLEENDYLFHSVKIVTHTKNVGIVNNFKDTICAIETNKFKIMAGDDIYNLNDIFSYGEKNEFVISPVFSLQKEKIVLSNYNMQQYNLALRHEKEIKQYLKQKFKFYFPLISPGILYTKDLVDKGFFDSIRDNRWIEDVLTMRYLINKENTKVKVSTMAYVIYRDDVGISNNSTHSSNKEYNDEVAYLNKHIFVNYSRYCCIYFNPHYYKRFFERKINNFISRFIDKKIINCNMSLYSLISDVMNYYEQIKTSAEYWYITHKTDLEEDK